MYRVICFDVANQGVLNLRFELYGVGAVAIEVVKSVENGEVVEVQKMMKVWSRW